jgi:hypothetical protein
MCAGDVVLAARDPGERQEEFGEAAWNLHPNDRSGDFDVHVVVLVSRRSTSTALLCAPDGGLRRQSALALNR